MPKSDTSTQGFVSIRDIKDNVIIQENGQMRMVVLASSINFALKSVDEQRGILSQFQSFLNTLDFDLQIYIQSRRLDIEPYLELLKGLDGKQNNNLMRIQLREYMEFIRTFTKDIDVMSKNFFVVIPYSPSKVDFSRGITDMFSPKTHSKRTTSEKDFEEHRIQLEQRVGLVTAGLARVGVRSITLQKDDLVELYYHLYNPADLTGSAPLSQ